RLPEDLDVVLQRLDDLVALFLVESVGVELFAVDEDAAERLHDGAAARFGRMGGEDRNVARLIEQPLQLLRCNTLLPELAQSMVEGPQPQRTAARQLTAALTVPEGLLGDIDQTEVEMEGAYHMRHQLRVEVRDELHQARAQPRV